MQTAGDVARNDYISDLNKMHMYKSKSLKNSYWDMFSLLLDRIMDNQQGLKYL
jgi:hypothetical protein